MTGEQREQLLEATKAAQKIFVTVLPGTRGGGKTYVENTEVGGERNRFLSNQSLVIFEACNPRPGKKKVEAAIAFGVGDDKKDIGAFADSIL